jgi:hypothetical protein
MADMPVAAVPSMLSRALDALVAELRDVFGDRLASVVAFGPHLQPPRDRASAGPAAPANTLALVDRVDHGDLLRLAEKTRAWRARGVAVPLLLSRDEFARSLDAFPLEYGDIIARHVVLAGPDPFEGLAVRQADVRRALERQAKSHLIHLREGFLETGGGPADVADLMLASAVPFASLVETLARSLGGDHDDDGHPDRVSRAIERATGAPAGAMRDVLSLVHDPLLSNDEARRLFPLYLEATEALVRYVDGWAGTAE